MELDNKARAEAAKKRLRKWKDLTRDIPLSEKRLQAIQQRIDALGGQTAPDGLPHGKGLSHDRMADMVSIKVDLENEIKKKKARIKAEYDEIQLVISNIECAEERFILLSRYVDDMDWKDIVSNLFDVPVSFDEKFDYYERQTYRKHGSALLSFSLAEEELKYNSGKGIKSKNARKSG